MLPSRDVEIIPGLPDEIALCILARLPRYLDRGRHLICHAWKDAMEAASRSSLRQALNISEEWLVFTGLNFNSQFLFAILDPRKRCGRIILLPQELQHLYFWVISAVGSEVLVAATPLWPSEKGCELQGVYSFDALSMKWGDSKYSSLPDSLVLNPLCRDPIAAYMAGGHLYVTGGVDMHGSLQGVERLDTKSRMWEALPDPHVKRQDAVGLVLQGLFYLIGGCQADGDCVNSGEIWDPAIRQWALVPELCPFDVFGSSFEKSRVVAFKDQLYALSMTDELMRYENVSKSWISLGYVPLQGSEVCLLGMGQELWVVDPFNNAIVATKPTFTQPISWRTLPHMFIGSQPFSWDNMVGVLHV